MPQVEDVTEITSAIGTVRITATGQGITGISFMENDVREARGESPEMLHLCKTQLLEYFSGSRNSFSDVPLAIRGTDFQQRVWDALLAIPFGTTVTYADIAVKIGEPRASRAVGQAVGKNPLALLIPCHRVVPSKHSTDDIGGFAWGSWRKKWLLRHEKVI